MAESGKDIKFYMPMFLNREFQPDNATTLKGENTIHEAYQWINGDNRIMSFFDDTTADEDDIDMGGKKFNKVNDGNIDVAHREHVINDVASIIGQADPTGYSLSFEPGLHEGGIALFGQLDGSIMRFNEVNGWVNRTCRKT